VPAPAVDRLAALNLRSAELMTVVDNPDNARAIAQAVERAGDAKLSVIIDVDPGIHRTGVASPEAAVELFETIRALPALVYRGVQFYCGSHQHIHAFAERETAMRERADYLRTVIAALAEAGGAPEIATGGGTGTHRIDAGLGIFTELQVGSYIFMDDEYRACDLTGEEGAPIPFETSLMIDTSVISANTPGLFTLDAGIKSMATDAPLPSVETGAPEGARFFLMGDEHGAVLTLPDSLALGDRVSLRTPHCDPTVNLYDNYHVVRGQTLDAIWPVSGRGRSR
jgi:D-serine deaminase-like pyridoxal phosphate-dependent protein